VEVEDLLDWQESITSIYYSVNDQSWSAVLAINVNGWFSEPWVGMLSAFLRRWAVAWRSAAQASLPN
jgi:hypothetical protein